MNYNYNPYMYAQQPNVAPYSNVSNQGYNLPNQAQSNKYDDRIWVQGEVGAKAYLVAPMNTVTLWDTESQTIFIKSVNANGMPVMTKARYTFEQDKPEAPKADYITREEFEKAIKELKETQHDEQ